MSGGRVERHLTAILAMDVVGYSRLMGHDEEGTLAALKAIRSGVVDPSIASHRGRIVKTIGDGLLVEFASVVEATRSAVEIQTAMRTRDPGGPAGPLIRFRMGVNVGDVIVEGDDLFGDGVNIAARLEGIAEPGGICVSARVREDAEGKVDAAFEDMGEPALKNIERPIRVYRIRFKGETAREPALALPDKPSIAALRFENLTGDPKEDYFADGMVEEIITALSRMRWLFVIARNSSFAYKGRAVDTKQVGRELGVRYVLQGSVRRAANRIRISGQLIDAVNGGHLWADRFDGGAEDVFDLQDQVTASVIGAIAPRLEQAEIERARRKPTGSLDAYDCYLRGLASAHALTREGSDEALLLFRQAIALDPAFASAYGMAAWCFVFRKANGWMADRERETAETERLAQRAIDLGKDDAVALSRGGHALAFVLGQHERGLAYIERALALDANLASAWLFSSWVQAHLGNPDLALERAERALRLSPLDPLIFGMENAIAFSHFLAGRYEAAAEWSEKSLGDRPDYLPSLRFAAASHALAGRLEQARALVGRIRQLDPDLRISNLAAVVPFRRPEDLDKLSEGLRKAGLPE